jgi:transcriptional regulator with XRE-family HTH domain
MLVISERLRLLRESKKLSQGDIENRTGLLRCYVSRVENGYTIPSIETLEKLAGALELPLYEFLYDGEAPPANPSVSPSESEARLWGHGDKDGRSFRKLRTYLSRMTERDRILLLDFAQHTAGRKKNRKRSSAGQFSREFR